MLGLENGDRPPLGFPGYWLYSGGVATVHLMGTRKPREGIVVRGTEKKYEDTGRLDHIAFAATDVDGVRKRLQSKNVKFRESIVPRTGDTQILPLRSRRRRRGTEFPQGVSHRRSALTRQPGQPIAGRACVSGSSAVHIALQHRWLGEFRFKTHSGGEPRSRYTEFPTRSCARHIQGVNRPAFLHHSWRL